MKPYNPIAIIGYGCIFPPNGYDNKKFWENVLQGTNGIIDVSDKCWKKDLYYSQNLSEDDKTYCSKGGKVIDYVYPYDKYRSFGIPKSEIEKLNRSQKMVLDTVLHSILASGMALGKEKIGMYMGNMLGDEIFPNYVLERV